MRRSGSQIHAVLTIWQRRLERAATAHLKLLAPLARASIFIQINNFKLHLQDIFYPQPCLFLEKDTKYNSKCVVIIPCDCPEFIPETNFQNE